NKWMFLSMLIGFLLAATLLSSIPLYTQGVTQKVLLKDLENYQIANNKYPVSYSLKINVDTTSQNSKTKFEQFDMNYRNNVLDRINLPTVSETNKLIGNDFVLPNDDNDFKNSPNLSVMAATGIENHITLTYGKLYSEKKQNDVIEAIVTEQAMQNFRLTMDNEYVIYYRNENKYTPVKIKIVGIFKNKDSKDSFWNKGLYEYDHSIIMNYNLLKQEFLFDGSAVDVDSEWFRAYDYHKITTENIEDILNNINYLQSWVGGLALGDKVTAVDILSQYNTRQHTLKIMLLVLEAPVLIMLLYYLFMVSQLVIEQDKKEIAVLKSRGAGKRDILRIYLLQGIILSVIAMIFGPPLGLFLCKLVGSTDGFLEFVQRTALPVKMNVTAYLYALCACIIFVITMLIPAFVVSKTTIVRHNQENARLKAKSPIQKYYIDAALFLISLYGYYSYKSQQKILNITRVSGLDIPMNPFLFAVTSLFIFSLALLFVRIFPYVIRLIFKVGQNRWKPAMYSSLVNLSRAGGKNNFLIVFLIVTVATGIFSSNSARTINTNIDEREKYEVGADITIMARWLDTQPAPPSDPRIQVESPDTESKIIYKEPDFKAFEGLSGIEEATKVMNVSNVKITDLGKKNGTKVNTSTKSKANGYNGSMAKAPGSVGFMAVIPNEFGKIAWFRSDLLEYHWYNYLNFLTKYPSGILVSSSLEKSGVKLGDDISIDLGDGDYFTGTVLAFIDYWPGYNQYSTEAGKSNNLIVGNFNYLQTRISLRPYEVWAKKAPGATSAQIYADIEEKGLDITKLKDSSQNIMNQKNDPIIEGTNGALTLGFLTNLLITLAGFIIFWILTIKGRTYQFGILRAMGLHLKEVIVTIFSELLLLSVSAIIIGVAVGEAAGKLFVPLLQITGSSEKYVPPFKVTEFVGDYVRLYAYLFLMLVAGLLVLRYIIKRININQALKLGED
ncbi:MAG: FtsX-like permease family protein, partial [Bacillota bacterium]|nr:FtsX-like permease family protein [Bacillota bacterium]